MFVKQLGVSLRVNNCAGQEQEIRQYQPFSKNKKSADYVDRFWYVNSF
jgi:hypothetical protein